MTTKPTAKKAAKKSTRKPPTKAAASKKAPAKKTVKKQAIPSVDASGKDSDGVRVITEMDADYQPIRHRAGRPDVVSPKMNDVLSDMQANGQMSVQLVAGEPFTIFQIRNWADKVNRAGVLMDSVERIRVAFDQEHNRITIILVPKED